MSFSEWLVKTIFRYVRKINEHLESANNKVLALERDCSALKAKNSEQSDQLGLNGSVIDQLKADLQAEKEKSSRLVMKLNSTNEQLNCANQKAQALEKDNSELKFQNSELNNKLSSKDCAITQMKSVLQTEQEKSSKLVEELKDLKQQLAQSKTHVDAAHTPDSTGGNCEHSESEDQATPPARSSQQRDNDGNSNPVTKEKDAINTDTRYPAGQSNSDGNYQPKNDDSQSNENDSKREAKGIRQIKAHKSDDHESKEHIAIELSDGSFLDFPPIMNDSNRDVRRSIEYIYDPSHVKILADDFFKDSSAEEIARVGHVMAESVRTGDVTYVCGKCNKPVVVGHRTCNGNESLFFAHASKSSNCPWVQYQPATDTVGTEVYDDQDVIDYGGEGFKSPSQIIKEAIYALLTSQPSKDSGITEVRKDTIVRSTVPNMRWRRPDISFKYEERYYVILLQKGD